MLRLKPPTWLVRIGQFGITLGLFALIWRTVDGPEAARSLATSNWRWLTVGVVFLSLQTLLSALRWQITARQLGIVISTRQAVAEYYLSQLVNQSLPGGMIGDASRAMRSKGQAGLLAAGEAVVFERLAGQMALFVTFSVSFIVTLGVPGGLDWPQWLAAPVALLIILGLGMPFLIQGAIHLPGSLGRATRQFRAAFVQALGARSSLPTQILLSFGTAFCNLTAFAVCARAVGVELGVAAIVALVPLILFTMLIPISISGWGFREGAAATLLPVAGASASGGLAASVAFGLVMMAAALPGFLLLWIAPRPKVHETGQLTPP